MTTFILTDDNGTERPFDNRAEAEETKAELEAIGANVEVTKQATDGGAVTVQDKRDRVENNSEEITDDELDTDEAVADAVNTANEISRSKKQQDTETELPDSPDVTEDPVSWMPSHFIDQIEGVPAINRKGYAVLAEHFEISVVAEPLTIPSESDWEFAEFRAVATTSDGREYSGFGSAHVERGDDKVLLGEMAETRAVKRATADATGVGMTAVSELQNSTEVVE